MCGRLYSDGSSGYHGPDVFCSSICAKKLAGQLGEVKIEQKAARSATQHAALTLGSLNTPTLY